MSVHSHQRKIKQARKQIVYLNKRIKGITAALTGQKNQALIKALNEELKQINIDLTAQQKIIRDAEYEIQQMTRAKRKG